MYGLEEFLGFASFQDGWVNREERPELEKAFWETFWEKVPLKVRERREKIQSAVKISKGIGVLWNNVGDDGVAHFLEQYPYLMILIKGQL